MGSGLVCSNGLLGKAYLINDVFERAYRMILDSTILVEYVGIFSVAIGLHIFKTGGDKIRISNSGGDMPPPSPP